MTAAETQLVYDTELERAGYQRRDAVRLAERHDVDLHLAIDLISRGCPAQVALDILL